MPSVFESISDEPISHPPEDLKSLSPINNPCASGNNVFVIQSTFIYCLFVQPKGNRQAQQLASSASGVFYYQMSINQKLMNYFAIFTMPLSSFWMYSNEAILALVSSRFRRRVLSELNSNNSHRFESPSVKY